MTRNRLAFLLCGAAALALALPALAKDETKVDNKVEKKRVVVRVPGDEPHVFEFDSEMPGGAVWLGGKGGYLGVHLMDLTPELRTHFGVPEQRGVLVSRIEPDGPAAKAGLKVGDIIVGVGNEEIARPGDVRRQVRDLEEGANVKVDVVRDRRQMTVDVTVAQRERQRVDIREFTPGDFDVHVDPEAIREQVERSMRDRAQRHRDLEARMKELEQKLAEMEKQLQK